MGVVIFRASGDPGTVSTRSPSRSMSIASSVISSARALSQPSAWACAAISVAAWKPCGVCTARRNSRAGVPVTCGCSAPVSWETVLMVSTTGSTGITAVAPPASAPATESKTSGGVRHRAASWISTCSTPGPSADRPARTESLRVLPPLTVRGRNSCLAQSAASSLSPAGKTTMTSSAQVAMAMRSSACSSSVRLFRGTSALGMPYPSRVPDPAATTMTAVRLVGLALFGFSALTTPDYRCCRVRPGREAPGRLNADGVRSIFRCCGPHRDQALQNLWLLRGKNLVKHAFGFVFVKFLGQRKFADQDLAGLCQHALFAGGKATVVVSAPKVSHDLGNLDDVT